MENTIEEDSEEECESDLYKQYSHLVYHEVDAIDGSPDAKEDSIEIGNDTQKVAPQELVLEDEPDSVPAAPKSFSLRKRRYLNSVSGHHKIKTGGRRRWRHLSSDGRHLAAKNALDNKKHGYGKFYASPQKVTYYNKYWDPKT